MDRKNMLLSVQHPPVYKSGLEWALFTPQHGANALTEMMLMHYTGSCFDIFRATAEGCDGLPLRQTPSFQNKHTHTNKHAHNRERKYYGGVLFLL